MAFGDEVRQPWLANPYTRISCDCYFKVFPKAGATRWLKCLLLKYEDLSSGSQHSSRRGMVVRTYNPSMRRWRRRLPGALQLASSAQSVSSRVTERLCLKRYRGEQRSMPAVDLYARRVHCAHTQHTHTNTRNCLRQYLGMPITILTFQT